MLLDPLARAAIHLAGQHAQVLEHAIGTLAILRADGLADASGVAAVELDRQIVQVAPYAVVALKALAARPIRTREIRALEVAAVAAWPGLEMEWVDGWLLRAGAGFTRRANSAIQLGDPGQT